MDESSSALSDKSLSRNVKQLVDFVLEENPMHRRFLEVALDHINQEELGHLETYLSYCADKGMDIPYIGESYLTIVADTLREQIYFMTNKEYRHKSFADVAGDIYFNDEYMNRYMYGLAITSFLWPNHVTMARYFRETFPQTRTGRYLEVGPGHGYNIMTAMKLGALDEYLGIDISQACVKQTQAIVEYFEPDLKQRLNLAAKDFLAAEDLAPASFDAIVMGEVLEHVEEPEAFLRRIAELAKSDAYIYITTCINTPAIDHIYLWRTTGAVEDMIRGCGLNIKSFLHLAHDGKTVEESEAEGLAVSVAYVLEKA